MFHRFASDSLRALILIGVVTFVGLDPIVVKPATAQDLEAMLNEIGFLPPGAATLPAEISFVNRPDVLELEPAVAQAELILAVRLVDVTETKIVHGGQNVQITQQYRFEPVRVLKGIFVRETLLMTGQDLGVYRFAEGSDRLERGQLMLVLLGRQGQNYFNCNCNGVPTLGQSIPRLESKDDPLLAAVDVLIAMIHKRDRAERVALLRDGLKTTKGRETAPLLLALRRRALLASQDPEITDVVLPHLKSDSAAIREVTARTVASLLDAIPRPNPDRALAEPNRLQTEAAAALAAALADGRPELAARIAVIDALGSAGDPAIRRSPAALAWLNAQPAAATFAESSARLRALGKIGASSAKEEVGRSYEALLLDAPAEIQTDAGRALVRLDPSRASELVSARLARKDEAGLDVTLEITLLGELPRKFATPALLKAWSRSLDGQERLAFARACADVADARLVPAISTLLDPQQWHIRAFALEALRRINTDEAASVVWPHLDEEVDVARKLRLITFLGRHGYREGYPQALEHLSQEALREEAVAAVVAIGEPKAIPELRRIWLSSNDLAWNAAAIRALAQLGQQDITPRLLEIARTAGDPLAESALIGLGDLGSADSLPVILSSLSSRRDPIVIAATRASAKLLPVLAAEGQRHSRPTRGAPCRLRRDSRGPPCRPRRAHRLARRASQLHASPRGSRRQSRRGTPRWRCPRSSEPFQGIELRQQPETSLEESEKGRKIAIVWREDVLSARDLRQRLKENFRARGLLVMSKSWTIGTKPDCDLVVNLPRVSGYHCRLTQDDIGFIIEDLGSTNGTYVNGVRVTDRVRVTRSDSITFGQTTPMTWPPDAVETGNAPAQAVAGVAASQAPTLDFQGTEIVIGRSPDCSRPLDLPMVSSRHARLFPSGGRIWIEDLGSANGTFVNTQRISGAVAVKAGDVISLGSYSLVLNVIPDADVVAEIPAIVVAHPSSDEAPSSCHRGRTAPRRSRRLRNRTGVSLLSSVRRLLRRS